MAIKLIAGLGNPGRKHARDRHNAGFWFAERLAARERASFRAEPRYHADTARLAGEIRLVMPQTYMNLSGKAVGALARFYKIQPDEVLVAHDELDFPPGTVRLKLGGGVAGHNGLKDIAVQLGTQGFWRLRIGIDATYPPFGSIEGGEFSGFDVDIARAIARDLRVEAAAYRAAAGE